jgi:PAS domain S-box-containing protein
MTVQETSGSFEAEPHEPGTGGIARRFLEKALHTMQIGVTISDLEGRILYVNPAEEAMHGYAPGELIGQLARVLGPPERSRPKSLDDLSRLRSFRRESENLRKDGSRFPVRLLSDVVTDAAGNPLGLVTTCEDISEQKTAEQAKLERTRALERARALERSNQDLEQFAYVASHDLQEPLRKIIGFGERLAEKGSAALDEECGDYLERMRAAAQRMRSLIRDLLAYSRLSTRPQTLFPVSLHSIARQVLADLELQIEQLRADVQLGELPTVHADPVEMRQLLQNLIGNALKFHRPAVPPRVRVRGTIVREPVVRPALAEPLQEFCQIEIEDNGIGFDERHLAKIFTIFQRLHRRGEYEGTGIGLALCKKVIERHGGAITARSRLDAGSIFYVVLPLRQFPF